jgi:hypothetical protein
MTMQDSHRVICEKCGRSSIVASLRDVTIFIDKNEDGMGRMMRVCPEHKADWLRMISTFLTEE